MTKFYFSVQFGWWVDDKVLDKSQEERKEEIEVIVSFSSMTVWNLWHKNK